MSEHKSQLNWKRTTEDFTYDTYSRNHEVKLTGASFSMSSAPEYKGDAAVTNPEEVFVLALSSCHMLTFLAVAARKGFVVNKYEDHAVGLLGKDESGKICMTDVELRPQVWMSEISPEDFAKLHEQAHRGCFIANSVKTPVRCVPTSRQ